MLKKTIFILILLGTVSPSIANNFALIDNLTILAHFEGGDDKSSSISASINGHTLAVVFTENLGQVTIRIFNENGVPIDLMTTPTPNGQIIYIPLAGQYTVLFTLPNGDEYWGEFEVED